MSRFRTACEVYTWFMDGEGRRHDDRLDHMIAVAAQAGFTGIEPIHGWMGRLADPGLLAEHLDRHGIQLAALVLAQEWNGTEETDDERRAADDAIACCARFPGARLCLVQRPSGRHDLVTRRRRLLDHLHRIADRAAERGVPSTFHPNSPAASITRTRDDYAVLLDGLDGRRLGWTPDTGHLANGGMDPLHLMQTYAALIDHVHFKDWDGAPEFGRLGDGRIDFPGIVRWLSARSFAGWLVCEDEGHDALVDPDGTTLHDGTWLHHTLLSGT